MNVLDQYAADVLSGELPAGKYHRLACARHVRDVERQATPGFPYRFDLAKAERFFRFAQKMRHYKGEWAKRRIRLEPHQQFRLGSLFGWLHVDSDHLRRFRTGYNELPRKSGKSLEAAIVALYTTFFDGEPGAEGYCIATKRDQAKIVWNDAKKLVMSTGLRSRIKVLAANLNIEATSSKLEPLGADADSTDGLNPHLIIVDEFHKHKTRALIDVMESATGARRQPLNFQITTAGDSPISPCGDQHDYACKILDQIVEDETFFAFIAHADESDDWLEESTWRKANPNWNVSVKPDDMRALATKARNMPAAVAEFKQKRLNLWVNTLAPWLSMEGWRAGQQPFAEDSLTKERCYVGLDLASNLDLCAMVGVFPPSPAHDDWRLVRRVWTPADTLRDRSRADRAPYDLWASQGVLLTTPGTHVDHDVIRKELVDWRKRFQIMQVGYDPWHGHHLVDDLVRLEGFSKDQLIEIPQTYAGISAGAKVLEAEVLAGHVNAGGCPLMAWSASNAVVQRDGNDNLKPIKKNSRGRIDPIVATVIGVALQVRHAPVAPKEYKIIILGGQQAADGAGLR